MQNTFIIFIHLMAAAIGIGSLVFAVLLFLPAINKVSEEEPLRENSIEHKTLELLGPTVFVCLLILIGSGLYYMMENYTRQVDLASGYYNLFGIKILFVAVAFFISIYQTFTLRARIL